MEQRTLIPCRHADEVEYIDMMAVHLKVSSEEREREREKEGERGAGVDTDGYARTCMLDRTSRDIGILSVVRPDGSPICPVAPPTSAMMLCPASLSRTSAMTAT